jgi:ABC-type nickel/cobalt efflux system permease component RcnA
MAIMAIVSTILVILLGALVARAAIKHFFLGLDGEENEEEDEMTVEASDKMASATPCHCRPGQFCNCGHTPQECDGDCALGQKPPIKDPFIEKRFEKTT